MTATERNLHSIVDCAAWLLANAPELAEDPCDQRLREQMTDVIVQLAHNGLFLLEGNLEAVRGHRGRWTI
jgi:hypothetical protein